MPQGQDADPSGPSLRWVLGSIGVLVVVLGVLGFWRYRVSERFFATSLGEIDTVAPSLDVEGCVTRVLQWHGTCEANKPLCDNGVPQAMTHCLVGADRSSTCAELDLSSAQAQWVFAKCLDRGTPCKSRKACPCADAYRALDSFCRHGQKGVAL